METCYLGAAGHTHRKIRRSVLRKTCNDGGTRTRHGKYSGGYVRSSGRTPEEVAARLTPVLDVVH